MSENKGKHISIDLIKNKSYWHVKIHNVQKTAITEYFIYKNRLNKNFSLIVSHSQRYTLCENADGNEIHCFISIHIPLRFY